MTNQTLPTQQAISPNTVKDAQCYVRCRTTQLFSCSGECNNADRRAHAIDKVSHISLINLINLNKLSIKKNQVKRTLFHYGIKDCVTSFPYNKRVSE